MKRLLREQLYGLLQASVREASCLKKNIPAL